MGDPATELVKVSEEQRRRSDRDVDARPPLRQGRPARRHRRQGAAPGQGPGPAAARAVTRRLKPSRAVPACRTPHLCAIKSLDGAPPEPIHAHAMDNIRFIRDAMSRATEFTAVPGWGGVAMGVTRDRHRDRLRPAGRVAALAADLVRAKRPSPSAIALVDDDDEGAAHRRAAVVGARRRTASRWRTCRRSSPAWC